MACHQALDSSLPDAADAGSKDVRIGFHAYAHLHSLRCQIVDKHRLTSGKYWGRIRPVTTTSASQLTPGAVVFPKEDAYEAGSPRLLLSLNMVSARSSLLAQLIASCRKLRKPPSALRSKS